MTEPKDNAEPTAQEPKDQTAPKEKAEPKDKPGKLDIALTQMGGLLTALAVGIVGYWASVTINESQARDTDVRLYAQLMSQREDAETSLRKDMFNSIIETFLRSKPTGVTYEQQVLNLELLAHNFHEALDLSPLFKDVYMKIANSKAPNAEDYMQRLERVAKDVKDKQIAALEESGGKMDFTIDLEELQNNSGHVFEGVIAPKSVVATGSESKETFFNVEALEADPQKKEIRVKLQVWSAPPTDLDQKSEAPSDSLFTISPFDFPMIDNTRLPHGQRCALVVREFDDSTASITLIYFPGSRASLKEKPFYDEAMQDLLYTRKLLEKQKHGQVVSSWAGHSRYW